MILNNNAFIISLDSCGTSNKTFFSTLDNCLVVRHNTPMIKERRISLRFLKDGNIEVRLFSNSRSNKYDKKLMLSNTVNNCDNEKYISLSCIVIYLLYGSRFETKNPVILKVISNKIYFFVEEIKNFIEKNKKLKHWGIIFNSHQAILDLSSIEENDIMPEESIANISLRTNKSEKMDLNESFNEPLQGGRSKIYKSSRKNRKYISIKKSRRIQKHKRSMKRKTRSSRK